MICSITPELYRETAERLCDVVGRSEYFSGSVAFSFGEMDCRLTTSVIVYRRTVQAPDGVSRPISDLVPVWWEFHTVESGGEILNDFSFAEMVSFCL